ncbi:bifunctional metallophosphatase/5'-nucleotidase [Naumannella halotolerans]|uniref:2',3'-cyclic-nucleotide 2'-phosphodiesterase (5'-nucleotidase family) n=1 Tax=Naumannella halotolerans TaxID=993414 RepID=A0A4R7J2L9_9ACTN|nr:5'-nucleotidase C-terminal domain-containing protein [Naumannella halotolerans]TDT31265.1 2',3'-cyclic-nucleotide 2'-phosphodiesterase (5'-nucleotidase family) [Naumannella halotolerans]
MRTPRWLRTTAAISALGLTGMGVCVGTAQAAPGDQVSVAECTDPTALTFLNFNDFHGRIAAAYPDTVQFVGTIEELRAESGENSTVVASAGDNIGGSLFASAVAQDQPTLELLNALEIDTSAVGNHEFDKGYDDLTGRVADAADFSYLGANVYDESGEPALEEYEIVEKQGLRIGIIGAVTQETPNIVVPDGVEGLTFGDPVEAVNRVAEELKDGDESNGEADVIVAEYHEGGPSSSGSLDDQTSSRPAFANIVENTSELVQVLFTAHTHSSYVYDAPVPGSEATRPLIQSGSYAELVGHVGLEVDPETGETCTYTVQNEELTETSDEDLVAEYPRAAAAKEIVDDALAEADVIGQEVVGEATAPLARPGEYNEEEDDWDDDRTGESTITNLVANMFSDTLGERTGEKVIGVQNPGGTRADLCAPSGQPTNPCADEAFDITYADAASILPFANTLQTTTLTGAEFIEMLEQQWSTDADTGEPTGTFLRLGLSDGVAYTYDESRELGDRITSVTIDGEPIDPDAEYVVGSGNFLLAGGDNFHVFSGKEVADSGLVDLETWVGWIEDNSPLSPSFVKRGVEVSPTPAELVVGESTTLDVGNLDFSGGYPVLNETLVASVDGVEVGTAAVAGGTASITLNPGSDVPAGEQLLTLTGTETETQVHLPVTIVGESSPTPEPSDSASPSASPSGEPSDSPSGGSGDGDAGSGSGERPPLADTGAGAGLAGLLGAGALLSAGGAMLLRRRQG